MYSYFIIPAILGLLALLFLDPFRLLMPSELLYVILGIMLLLIGWYSMVVYKEQAGDEREELIRARVDRYTHLFTMTGLVLITGYYLITQGMVYPEIIVLFVCTGFIKILLYLYGERHW